MMIPVRDRIHRLVDQLPKADLPEVESLLTERLEVADPVLRVLATPTSPPVGSSSHEDARRQLLGQS